MAGLLLLAVLQSGCDESLPPRSEPVEFITAGLGVPTEPIIIHHGYPGEPVWGEVRGALGTIQVSVSNIHDEVLQESALIRAEMELRWIPDPTRRRLLTFDAYDLGNRNMLRGGMLTIGVDSAAKLLKFWDHRTNDGTPFWNLVSLRLKRTSKGVIYYESDSVRLIAEGWIQVFENVQSKKVGPLQIVLVYQLVDTVLFKPAALQSYHQSLAAPPVQLLRTFSSGHIDKFSANKSLSEPPKPGDIPLDPAQTGDLMPTCEPSMNVRNIFTTSKVMWIDFHDHTMSGRDELAGSWPSGRTGVAAPSEL